jgi:hypothetical protein
MLQDGMGAKWEQLTFGFTQAAVDRLIEMRRPGDHPTMEDDL